MTDFIVASLALIGATFVLWCFALGLAITAATFIKGSK